MPLVRNDISHHDQRQDCMRENAEQARFTLLLLSSVTWPLAMNIKPTYMNMSTSSIKQDGLALLPVDESYHNLGLRIIPVQADSDGILLRTRFIKASASMASLRCAYCLFYNIPKFLEWLRINGYSCVRCQNYKKRNAYFRSTCKPHYLCPCCVYLCIPLFCGMF